eukprot:3144577-Prymnesium_polylepis.2
MYLARPTCTWYSHLYLYMVRPPVPGTTTCTWYDHLYLVRPLVPGTTTELYLVRPPVPGTTTDLYLVRPPTCTWYDRRVVPGTTTELYLVRPPSCTWYDRLWFCGTLCESGGGPAQRVRVCALVRITHALSLPVESMDVGASRFTCNVCSTTIDSGQPLYFWNDRSFCSSSCQQTRLRVVTGSGPVLSADARRAKKQSFPPSISDL